MTLVNLWKPLQTVPLLSLVAVISPRLFVRTVENRSASHGSSQRACFRRLPSTNSSHLFQSFSTGFDGVDSWRTKRVPTQRVSPKMETRPVFTWAAFHKINPRGKEDDLLQRVHQPRDGTVKILVRPPQLLNLVD